MTQRYQVERKIGQGGIGAVYRALDTKLQRHVAIKRILPLAEEDRNRAAAESLRKEASVIASLRNPNIVTIYDVGTDEDGPFVVMELIKGENLEKIVKHAALDQGDFIEVVHQSLGGLLAAHHRGILHRDLKPKNIMVSWLPSGSFQVKLLDFGLAKFSVEPTRQTVDQHHNIMGSIHFMAPEQFERRRLDARTDLYAMGCLYYFALSQRHPFKGDTPAEVMQRHLNHEVKPLHNLREDLNPVICDWVMRLISRDRDARPPDTQTALAEFESIKIDPAVASSAPPVHEVVPLAIILPEIEDTQTTSQVAITGPVTAKQRALATSTVPTGTLTTASASATAPPIRLTSPVRTIPAPPPNRLKPYLITIAALIGLGGIAALALRTGDRSAAGPRDAGTFPPPASVPLPLPLPLQKNRVAHYSASAGVYRDDGKDKAMRGDRVRTWIDLAAGVSGNNALKQNSDDVLLSPTLEIAGPSTGLNGSHNVIRFHKGEGLTANRELKGAPRSHAGFQEALDGDQLTWFIVFKPDADAGAHKVFGLDRDEFGNACVTWFRNRSYQSGFRVKGDSASPLSTARCEPGQFMLLTAMGDGKSGVQLMDIVLSDGRRVEGSRVHAPVFDGLTQRFRLGQQRGKKTPGDQYFEGDIAEFILYNRALSDEDRRTVEDYLINKYFNPG